MHHQERDVTLHQGHVLDVLPTLPTKSINCVVTSPPYFGLRDYGVDGQIGLEASPAEYVDVMVEVFAQIRRVLRPEGTAWLNLGDSYRGRANGGATFDRHRGSGHREKIVAPQRNYGAAASYKSLLGIPWRVALALIDDGWVLRNAITWHKPNAMPEAGVHDRLWSTSEQLFMLTRSPKYAFDVDPIRVPHAAATAQRYAAGYQEDAPTSEARIKGGDRLTGGKWTPNELGRNPGDMWSIPTAPFAGAHFATMPPALARRCLLAGCPADGTVLDPFTGSGTTGMVARQLGLAFVGIDLKADYLDLAVQRIGEPTLDFGAVS